MIFIYFPFVSPLRCPVILPVLTADVAAVVAGVGLCGGPVPDQVGLHRKTIMRTRLITSVASDQRIFAQDQFGNLGMFAKESGRKERNN
ncbi:hypothetical protein E2C01_101062 [Portunus trituberculatus]|uniref:Secreted protein n=1 Tax=Portunus trituberculatus TaxID=210409 RepID=A0A5B7KEW9_PORTR|nr:hypothetical protein [Portunus trituberculatus]